MGTQRLTDPINFRLTKRLHAKVQKFANDNNMHLSMAMRVLISEKYKKWEKYHERKSKAADKKLKGSRVRVSVRKVRAQRA